MAIPLGDTGQALCGTLSTAASRVSLPARAACMMNIDPIESFLATVQSATEPQGSCAVQQSIAEWLAYYRWLRPISRGRPLATELDQRALFVLFAQATLDGIA